MRSTTSRKWSEEDDDYIRKNIEQGTKVLSEKFGVSIQAFRKRCSLLEVPLRQVKVEPKERVTKADNSEKFNPKQHKIKNSSTVGKIPFEIKSERMTVYLKPEQNNDKYKQQIVERYANRHKPIV